METKGDIETHLKRRNAELREQLEDMKEDYVGLERQLELFKAILKMGTVPLRGEYANYANLKFSVDEIKNKYQYDICSSIETCTFINSLHPK